MGEAKTKYYKNHRICQNCGKRDSTNLSNKYCSEKCRTEFAINRTQALENNEYDYGSYFDNFVDGKGY